MKKVFIFIIIFFSVVNIYSLEYTVVEGDCLWNIAKKYYNNPFLWVKIYQQNIDKIKNPDLIFPGQVFVLPEIEKGELAEIKPKIEKEEVVAEQKMQQEAQKTEGQLVIVDTTSQVISISSVTVEKQIVTKEKIEQPYSSIQKTLDIKDFKYLGKIVSAKEEKFMYIDYDIVFCEFQDLAEIKPGEILYVYHLGPSQYDATLLNVPNDQLNLVGKLEVIELKEKIVVCKILRAYSPIIIGDMITK